MTPYTEPQVGIEPTTARTNPPAESPLPTYSSESGELATLEAESPPNRPRETQRRRNGSRGTSARMPKLSKQAFAELLADAMLGRPCPSLPTLPTLIAPPVTTDEEWPVLFRGDAYRPRYVIYGLVDPLEPKRVRYVGKSSNPASRFTSHLDSGGADKRGKWIQQLQAEGRQPDMVLLEKVTINAVSMEQHWYLKLRKLGQADLNGTAPGYGPDFPENRYVDHAARAAGRKSESQASVVPEIGPEKELGLHV